MWHFIGNWNDTGHTTISLKDTEFVRQLWNISKQVFQIIKMPLHFLSARLLPSQSRMKHYSDVIMSTMASQITSVSMVCSTVCSGTDQRKRQSSALLSFVWGIHRSPVNSPQKRPVTRKMFPFGDVIMISQTLKCWYIHMCMHGT